METVCDHWLTLINVWFVIENIELEVRNNTPNQLRISERQELSNGGLIVFHTVEEMGHINMLRNQLEHVVVGSSDGMDSFLRIGKMSKGEKDSAEVSVFEVDSVE